MINLKITNIYLIFYDFDGIMTNNLVFTNQERIEMIQVNRADGLGLSEINKLGISQLYQQKKTCGIRQSAII